jgi:hypothetical protein
LTTNQAGDNRGLRLELLVHTTDLELAYRTGIRLLVHNQTKNEASITDENFLNVKPNTETFVGVIRSDHTSIPHPFTKCISSLRPFSEYSKRIFGFFADLNVTEYDKQLCVALCYQDKMIENCSCCATITNSIDGAKYCATKSELECEVLFNERFDKISTSDMCQDVCREACYENMFHFSTSFSSYPTRIYENEINERLKKPRNGTLSQHLLKLTVNYVELSYGFSREVPAFTFPTLLGNGNCEFS